MTCFECNKFEKCKAEHKTSYSYHIELFCKDFALKGSAPSADEEASALSSPWKERKAEPPQKSDHYLCIVLGSKVPLVLYYHADICTFTEFEDEYDPIYPVTHWMKLPKPPKEVEYEK